MKAVCDIRIDVIQNESEYWNMIWLHSVQIFAEKFSLCFFFMELLIDCRNAGILNLKTKHDHKFPPFPLPLYNFEIKLMYEFSS